MVVVRFDCGWLVMEISRLFWCLSIGNSISILLDLFE